LAPVVAAPPAGLTVDDKSGLYSYMIETLTTLGEKEAADKVIATRIAMLEEAASKATSPESRSTFDSHRLEEYLRAQKYDEAEKMLIASENAMPNDFNPPYRLAVLYKNAGKIDEGLAAADRALAKGYGARRLRMYSVKVDLLVAKKNFDWARKTIGEAKAEIAKMNKKVVRPSWLKELDSKMEAITKAEKASAS
jgi:tetratricopeptide (TPR) repeat protein